MKETLEKGLMKKVLAKLQNSTSNAFKTFRSRTPEVQQRIINLTYRAQAESMRQGIVNRDIVMIPGIGTFKIKETRLKSIEFSQAILEEYGVKHRSQLTKELQIEHDDRMSELMRKEILSRKLAKRNKLTLDN